MARDIRLRIAPSPTGEPHVGTAYIALFNRCYAKSRGGRFILRIEDTDRERSTPESERAILSSLKWLGLTWDEGPDTGGDHGPYRQSERAQLYRKQAEILISRGWAYKCFCRKEELEAIRARQMAAKSPQIGYFAADSPCRQLSPEEIGEKESRGIPYVIRLKVPDNAPDDEVSFYEHIRGKEISIKYREIDDQILLKSDGFPTYHLANVVDDYHMGVSVVMRGEEWIPSTFKHVLLYRAFGWESPEFYHLSLLRNADKSKSKISKRRNPVSLNWFRAAGYLPEALLNFLALMGYSRDTEGKSEEEIRAIELFTMDELMAEFDPSRLSISGPAFDYEKLSTINWHYIQKMSPEQFKAYQCDRIAFLTDYLGDLLPHVRERFRPNEKEMGYWTDFLFRLHLDYRIEDFNRTGVPPKELVALLGQVKKSLQKTQDTIKSSADFKEILLRLVEELKVKSKELHMALRISILGSMESLPLYESMSALGIYRCINRIDEAAAFLKSRGG